MNAIEACEPAKKYPPIFSKHDKKFKPHCRKYPNDYEEFQFRAQHYEAEKQTMMGEMSATRTEAFNEMIMEFGWISLFPPIFPAAALIFILSNAIQYKTEKDAIRMYAKRCEPISALDIGKWLDYFEFISVFGIINAAFLVIFTSTELTYFDKNGEVAWADLIVTILMIENCLIIFKIVLAALIPDNPSWIEKEMRL